MIKKNTEKKNWLVVWKITSGIWQIFTRALESWNLKLGLLWGTLIPSRKCMSLKFKGELCFMAMKKDAKFEKELTTSKPTLGKKFKRNWLVSSKLTWEIWRILIRALENLKNLLFNRLSLTKVYNVWVKRVLGSMFDDAEYWCKIWRKTDFCFQKWHE